MYRTVIDKNLNGKEEEKTQPHRINNCAFQMNALSYGICFAPYFRSLVHDYRKYLIKRETNRAISKDIAVPEQMTETNSDSYNVI